MRRISGGRCAGGSRDSLLVAVTTAMWGSGDAELVEMVRRLVYVALISSERLTQRADSLLIDESDATTTTVGLHPRDHTGITAQASSVFTAFYLRISTTQRDFNLHETCSK